MHFTNSIFYASTVYLQCANREHLQIICYSCLYCVVCCLKIIYIDMSQIIKAFRRAIWKYAGFQHKEQFTTQYARQIELIVINKSIRKTPFWRETNQSPTPIHLMFNKTKQHETSLRILFCISADGKPLKLCNTKNYTLAWNLPVCIKIDEYNFVVG